MRPARLRISLLALIPALCAVVALVLLAVGSAQIAEAETFWGQYSTPGVVQVDDTVFQHYNTLYVTATTLTTLAVPLLLTAVSAAFVLLAVLSVRRDATRQTAAPAAS